MNLTTEMYNNILIAQTEIKGYKFGCIGSWEGGNCRYCSKQLVTFVTMNIDQAYEHSTQNNMPMWISKDKGDDISDSEV